MRLCYSFVPHLSMYALVEEKKKENNYEK